MISVLVLGFSTVSGRVPALGDIVRTLTALVPGTVEGVVRDVALLSVGGGADLAKVADHAGCALIPAADFTGAIEAGVRQARCDLILVLPAGVTFDRSMTDEIAMAASQPIDGAVGPSIRMRSTDIGPLGRLLPRTVPTAGLFSMRSRLLTARASTFPALVRACRPSRSFKTRVWTGD